jgi:hypothetical protein
MNHDMLSIMLSSRPHGKGKKFFVLPKKTGTAYARKINAHERDEFPVLVRTFAKPCDVG